MESEWSSAAAGRAVFVCLDVAVFRFLGNIDKFCKHFYNQMEICFAEAEGAK